MRSLARPLAGLVLIVAATAGVVVTTAGASAASCAEPSADAVDTSDVAFAGVVTNRSEPGDDVITTMKVDRVFKGDITRRVDVVSPADEADLSMTAGEGESLLVFGRLDDGEVTSSLCRSVSETTPGGSYREIVAELGAGTPPTAGYARAERRTLGLSYEQFSAGRAVLGALGLLVMGSIVFRAWRARRHTRD